jgi:hypothetical protein
MPRAPTLADSLRLLHLGPDVVEGMVEKLYAAKLAEYRTTLSSLRASYGGPARVYLSTEIRDALLAEAERDAGSVASTYNRLLDAEARRSDLRGRALFDHLAAYARERGRVRAPMIARSTVAPARLDATVSFFLENGVEPEFDFVGPAPRCVICRTLKETGPHPFKVVIAVGIPHIQCTHRWRGRVYSAAKLRAAGIRPGTISAGAGPPAGIVGGESLRERLAGLPDDQVAEIIRSGELAEATIAKAESEGSPEDELEDAGERAHRATDPTSARDALGADASRAFAGRAAEAVAMFRHNPDASTMDAYGNGDREITDPARTELHKAWGEASAAGIEPPSGRAPRVVLMQGGGGAGKGKLIESGLGDFLDPERAVHADPDEAKLRLPEFSLLTAADAPAAEVEGASARVHRQSSLMNERATDVALDGGLDLVYDKVGGTADNWQKRAQEIVDRVGAENVEVHVVTKPTDEAIAGAEHRAESTRRHVAEDELRQAHARVSANWHRLRDLGGVKASFWDTRSKPPKLIAELLPNGELRVFDANLWAEFEAKAHGVRKMDPVTEQPEQPAAPSERLVREAIRDDVPEPATYRTADGRTVSGRELVKPVAERIRRRKA